jgi:hypothetical protein
LSLRMQRDGWRLLETFTEIGGTMGIERTRPVRWCKQAPGRPGLQILCQWTAVSYSPWLEFRYRLADENSIAELGVLDWADWDSNGDLLCAEAGKILRLAAGSAALDEAIDLVDFKGSSFKTLEAPASAKIW